MKPIKKAFCCLAVILCSLSSFGQDYKAFLEQGQKLYNERQYDAAIKVLNAGLVGSDENAVAELKTWIKRCNDAKAAMAAKAKADRERFDVSQDAVSFFSEGGTYAVNVDAAANWTIGEHPEWCSLKNDGSSLTITCLKNKDLTKRTGEVRIIMTYIDGKTSREKSRVISVSQDAREPEVRQVHFVTSPGNAKVRFSDDKIEGNSSETFTLVEGDHKAVISKPMFIPKEVTININPDDQSDLSFIKVDLEPQFSRLKLKIDAADGSMISENDLPSFRVGDQYVNLAPYFTGRGGMSFDSEDEIAYNKLYDGNIIPVAPGTYTVSVKAENFYPFDNTITVGHNEEKFVEIVLQPHKGLLHVFNDSGAEGAKIIVDKKEVGIVPSSVQLPKGSHVIEFIKPGYVSTKKSYLIEIGDNETAALNLEMRPYTLVTITSEPSNAVINFDVDEYNVYSPVVNERITQGIHKYKITKQGFMTQFGELNVVGDSLSLHFNLKEAFPMRISTEKNAEYLIKVQDMDGNVLTEPDATNSEPVYLPYGKYKLELVNRYSSYTQQGHKIIEDLVYKGKVDFHGQESIRKLTFSENRFALLGGTWYPSGVHFNSSELGEFSSYASINFLRFELFKGFTTSLLRADAYRNTTQTTPRFLFSGTCLFLNGELRVGGALHDYADFCLLGSYKWTPNLDDLGLIKYDYLSGWDWFVGVELSSRIPIINGSLRLGWQGLNGNLSKDDAMVGNGRSIVPYKGGAAVMSLNFTLGGRDSKGFNYIRVF